MKAVNKKLRRAVCSILALAMTLTLFSVPGFSGAALAAPEDSPSSETSTHTSSSSIRREAGIAPYSSDITNAGDSDNKPTLYIDFLGDNAPGYSGAYIGADGSTAVPSDRDQSAWQMPNPPEPWKKYGPTNGNPADCTPTTPGTVFWVGVGIDKMTLFELAKEGHGLTGLELGFYYNTNFVEPYTGANDIAAPYAPGTPAEYKNVLSAANLSATPNILNQWDANTYDIVEAIPERGLVMEEDTQEILFNTPTNLDVTAENGWEMLYVSLEKKDEAWDSDNRFADAVMSDNDKISYVMMLPFVLKAYDPQDRICFRLSRNASLFSIGGAEYGADIYDSANNDDASFGAWEMETRTPNHNLKEMFSFEGDLNIFTGKNEPDRSYTAILKLPGLSTDPANGAKLYPSSDSSVYIDAEYDDLINAPKLTGLNMGDSLTLEVTKGSNVTVSVSIAKTDAVPGTPSLGYTEVTPGSKYTFTMPNDDVTVTVRYTKGNTDDSEYSVELIKSDPNIPPLPENKAEIEGTDSQGVSHTTNVSGTTISVAPDNTVSVDVDTHPDYRAKVEVKTKAGADLMVGLPNPGNPKYTFVMPSADVEVTVTYEELPRHYAELSVDAVPDVTRNNTAKLSYKEYSANGGTLTTPVEPFKQLNGHDGGREELGPIPANREVRLDIHIADGCMVSEIRLYNGDDSGRYDPAYIDLLASPGLTMTDSENGYLTFAMPNNRVQVHVVFAVRRNYNAKLFLQNGESADMWGYMNGPNDTPVYNETNMSATPKKNTIQVWPGNMVTVELKSDPGYSVDSVTVTWGANNSIVYNTFPNDKVEFTMPAADVNVFVEFRKGEDYNATLVLRNMAGGSAANAYDGVRTGWPQDSTATPAVLDWPTKYGILENNVSTAWVQVKPGWYIANVWAEGLDSSPGGTNTGSRIGYPIANGVANGYNNGLGGRVEIKVVQPSEDITVHVEMKEGIPPTEPEYTLILQVDDPDNTGAPLANNWAQVKINSAGPQPAPEVSLINGNNNYQFPNTTYPISINAGQEVEVIYHADTGYRMTGVSVTPTNHGIVPTPSGVDRKHFTMPAGSVVVTVHFEKIDPDEPAPYTATLHVTGAVPGEWGSLTNTASGDTDRINGTSNPAQIDGTPIPAWPGDRFETDALLAGVSHFVTVDVYQGGSVVPWTEYNYNSFDGKGEFIMPTGNVDVYMNFGDTEPPTPNQHKLSLTAYGPTGTATPLAPGDAGTVDLTIGGTYIGTAASDQSPVPTITQYVAESETVLLNIKPNTGYVVDRIVYTSTGTVSPRELAPLAAPANNRAVSFAMPPNTTGVEVYFREEGNGPDEHTANIILRMEGSPTAVVDTAVVGDAQFDNLVPGGGYSKSATAGTRLDIEAMARNGYYISRIEITPANLGVAGGVTGVFANQDIDFIMPDADCTVNVYFRRGWPDEADLRATLNVHGPSGVPNNNAQLFNTTASTSAPAAIIAGQSQSLPAKVGQEMKVKINVETGYILDTPILVKDSTGTDVSYWWSGADEISFRMPNTLVTVDVTFKKEDPDDPVDLKATLYNQTTSTTEGELIRTTDGLTTNIVTAGNNGQITTLKPGEPLRLTVTNVPAGKAPVVLVRTADSVVVTVPDWTEAGGVYTTSFPMQDKDVEVFLTETDKPGVLPDEYQATLVVNEYNTTVPDPNNKASMYDNAPALMTATGTVSAVGTAAIRAVAGDTVAVHVDGIAPGYTVRSVEVHDASGTLLSLAQPDGDTYTYTMPYENVTAVVTFEKFDPDKSLTAQVVVNNGGGAGNDAVIRKMGDTNPGVVRLDNLQPRDQIEVLITVQPGYRVKKIVARATGGQEVDVSDLQLSPEQSQNVHFFMPNDNVVVYVEFETSGELHQITLDVVDHTVPSPNLSNTAALHTGYSGWSAYINDPAAPVTAQGSVNDMVQVKINPQPNYYAVVYAVSDDVNVIPVPDLTKDFLVDATGKTFTFSVPNNDVKVTVHYYPNSVPKPQHKVRLHITGVDGLVGKNLLDYCILPDTAVWQVSDTANTTSVPTVMEITVDYLEVLMAQAVAKNCYVQSAVAKVGNTILTPNPGTTVNTPSTFPFTSKAFAFTMQNSDIDVYMVFTDEEPQGPYTASLTVTGPADVDWQGNAVYGAAGSAVLTNTSATPTAISTHTVLSNQPYNPATDSVTADEGDILTVDVSVNPGYSIDRVLVTPLGFSVTPTSVTTDTITGVKTYTYSMPAGDINIDVRLKSDDIDRYKVTLNLTDAYLTANPTATTSVNSAKVSYTVYELTTDGAWMNVPDTQYVCVETNPGAGYYVYRAYAVTQNGTVLPLVDKAAPTNITPLQYPNDRPPVDNHKAWFEMPAEDVDVFIEFTTEPPFGNYSAIVTVLDTDPTHASFATLTVERTGGLPTPSVRDDSNPGSSDPISVNALETIKGTLYIATGWALDSITVTGSVAGGATPTITLTPNSTNPNEYSFTMPAHDVGVVVKLKSVPVDGYKATLHIVDHSSAVGNQVTMKDTVGGLSVNTDGGMLTRLKGNELIQTTVTPQPNVVIRSVIVTDDMGSSVLPSTAVTGVYEYTMNNHDVDITVVFDNDDPNEPDMFLAIVEKTGVGATVAGNTATVTNTSNPALPSGAIWTGIYGETPMQRLRVDVSAVAGYNVTITAKTKDSSGQDIPVPVSQLGVVGTVVGYLEVPSDLYDNVIITVEYGDTPQSLTQDLSLEIIDPNANAGNTAAVKEQTTMKLQVNGSAPTTAGPESIQVGATLNLTTNVAAGYLKKAELISNGVSLTLNVNNGVANFRMPNAAAKVVVTLAEGVQTPRPHDNLHDDNFGGTSNPLYIDGYLTGQNLGGNQARIQVPNLYHKDLTPTTVPAYNKPANKYDYKLYLKSGESYVQLVQGVDYDVTYAGSYAPGTANATTGVTDPNTGWDFQIRSLRGESALTELLLDGGVLYITATDVTDPANPLAESEYVEVVLGPDTNRGKFTATLKIVDSSGLPAGSNQASMTINGITVTNDGDQIHNLQGDELIRTLAQAASGARVSTVTVTDSGGTRHLNQDSPGTEPERFPYYMTGEDVIITVYFEAAKDPDNPDATHYIAAVSKYGEISVPGNDAFIKNDSRDDLRKGSIWAEGNENNAMRVTVTVAAGYYATVTAYRKDNNDPVGVAVFGAGPGVISFDSLFTMPASDVQVEVTFTTDEPENLRNDLTLKLMGDYGTELLNAAKMQRQGSSVYELEVDASVTTIAIDTSDTEADVAAGTLFDLTTSHAADYYIEKVLVKVTTTPATAPITLTLDNAGEYKNFSMLLGETVVEVYFKEKTTEPRTPRPYDPLHSEAYNTPAYVAGSADDLSSPAQEGWILAAGETPDANGKKRVKVLVPTLHDDEYTPISDVAALENANIAPAGEYKFYWYDGFGYQELVRNVDIAIVGADKPSAYTAANGTVFTGYEMTLTALLPGSILEYYIKQGGKIYVTSNKAPGATPSQESDYTQVIIPRTYTATLHYKLEEGGVEVSGTGAKMTAWNQFTTTDNDTLSGTNGTEVVKISDIVVPSGYLLDGVVATTVSGTVNVLEGTTPGQYEYTMVNENVDVYVVYKKKDDPLRDKGPWIATVIKVNDGGMAGNNATIRDLDVTIPDNQKGNIWTAAYEGNIVRVNVTTEPGWYAKITAKTAGANGPVYDVPVPPFATGSQSIYGLFSMPNDHVDVTVEYIHGPMPDYDLTLRVLDADGLSANSATITLPSGATMVANGTAQLAGPNQVAANTPLPLATTTGSSHSIASVKMEIDGNGIQIDIPLIDGDSVPVPVMPMGNTVITVTFQRGTQTARPYDPLHSVAYNAANYPVPNTNPDLSETGMEGWILAERKGANDFKITVPTLHNKGTAAPGNLYHAGDDSNLPTSQPIYKLYWKDNMGIFHELKDGEDITVTIPSNPIIEDIYTYNGVDYDGYTFNVAVNLVNPNGDPNPFVGTFWGGYFLQEYIKNGGSIYITATGGASVVRDPKESEKTEVVFSRTDTYTATLHHALVDNTSGTPVTVPTAATMSEGATDVTADGGQIVGLDGDELIRVHSIAKPAGYRVVGVVATTDAGTENVLQNPANSEYEYTMVHKNVDLTVVYEDEGDPLREKGPWIATVIKENDGGLPGNTAAIEDTDVVIPDHQKGNIWTTAYEGNAVRVDVTTEPGWYAKITAETVGANGPVHDVDVRPVVLGAQSFQGIFYMVEDHVNVTVEYIHGPMPSYELTLEKVDADAAIGNKAILEANDVGSASVDGATLMTRVPDAATEVPAGTKLKLTATAAAGHHVVDAKMIIDGFPTPIDIPLIDDVSLPLPLMPMSNARVVVTYDTGEKTARPYDPDHSVAYNSSDYPTNIPDLSKTHMEGWILAEKDTDDTTGTKFSIHVPTLHNNKPADTVGTLYNAGDASNLPGSQPTYKLYWKDNMDVFHELEDGVDIKITDKRVEGTYSYGGVDHSGYTLDVEILLPNPSADPNAHTVGTYWGGYSLQEYLKHGGSIYITATGGASGDMESEKTEVVFKSEEFKATLHIVNHSSHPDPGDVSMTDSISVVTEDGESFGTAGDATIKTTVRPNPGVVVRSVIATDASGSHVLTGTSISGGMEYTYTMDDHDVDITVVFDNDDDDDVEKMYLAIVEKTGEGLELAGNTAAITNTTNSALPKGDIWTGIYGERPKQRVQVDVTTEAGYYAEVTAVTKDNNGADVSVPVLQVGNTGVVTAYVDIPSDLYANVIITVNYTTTQPTDEYDLELELVDPNTSSSNTAAIDTTPPLRVDGTSLTAGPERVQVGAALNVATSVGVGDLLKVELEANGITTVLTTNVGVTGFAMPNGDARVVVTLLKAGKRTPRPHDNRNDDNFSGTSDPRYIDGYLKGQNLGGNRALIEVPNLYHKDLTPTTVPAYNEPENKYEYKLYLKSGGSYVELRKGVDYDVTRDESYDPGTDNVTTGVTDPETGWRFQIRSLKGESALTELILNGGVMYITATDVTDPANRLEESEYVEVVLPADPNTPTPDDPDSGYKATLWVVDTSGVSGNTAGMFIDGHTQVDYNGDGSIVDASQGDITQLVGNETIRTTAQAASGARISAVTVTDAAGTRLLPEVPDNMDPKRFPYYMTGEDVIITVYFEAEDDPDDPDDTRFIAAVAKYGAIAVPGNDVTIKNTTRDDVLKGNIWTEGYETNDIEVTISLAAGYYAEVEAIKMSDGSKFNIDPSVFGPGPGNNYILKLVMPASDVQINVNFVKELDNDLQPYDPANTGSDVYADHWITSENQGDRLVVVVPELNKKDGGEDTEVDKAIHGFHFYMEVNGNDAESLENVIDLSHPDPTDTSGDPYENNIYYPDPTTAAGTDPTKYHGARFILTVKTDDEIDEMVTTSAITAAEGGRAKELAALLRAIMDNTGTENSIANGVDVDLTGSGTTTNYKCRLYITHTDSTDAAFESDQVDFEIPRYFSLTGELESYAPAHIADLTLELFDEDSGEYLAPTYDYEPDTPYHMALELQERKIGNGLWLQDFAFKSSKLAGKKYRFVAKKAAHITYKRPEVSLVIADAPAGRYDPATLAFSFDAPIELIAGDVDGNQQVKFRDWDYLLMYMYGQAEWTTIADESEGTPDEWAISVYNPDSGAYAADLTGDGRIDESDEMVLMHERNYNRTVRHYNSPKGLDLTAGAMTVATFAARRSMMRMAPRMAMNVAGSEVVEEEDELSIPEWAAELVRTGVRVPMWAIELIRRQVEMPEWALEIIYSGQSMPDWALALLQAGETLPDWAMELIENGEALPEEPQQPKPEKEEKIYTITSDTVIKDINKPGKGEKPTVSPEPKPENEKDAYTISSDTDIKTIDKGTAQKDTEDDDKDSQLDEQPEPETKIEDATEPPEEEVLTTTPQEDGGEMPEIAENQEIEDTENDLPNARFLPEQA